YAIVFSASLLSAALYGVGVGVDSFLALALRGTAAAPTPGDAPNRSRSGSPEPAWLRILQFAAAPVALVLLWELASPAGLIPACFSPARDAVVPRWLELVASGQLIADLAVTLARLVAAVVVSHGLAFLLLRLVEAQPRIGTGVLSLVRTLGAIPSALWVPIALLMAGLGSFGVVFAAAPGAVFPPASRTTRRLAPPPAPPVQQ